MFAMAFRFSPRFVREMMRSTGNFSPEWGYLAPAPSILRTIRVVLVATAVGATAGAGVVLSLVDHSSAEGEHVSVAAHAIVTSAQAAPVQAIAPQAIAPHQVIAPTASAVIAVPVAVTVPTVSEAKIAPAPAVTAAVSGVPQPDNTAHPAVATATQASQQASATPRDSANDAEVVFFPQPAVATLSDVPTPATAAPAPAVTNDVTLDDQTFVGPQQPKKTKHHTANVYGANGPDIGRTLRHLFSARAGTSYYPH
jgi:hypothetical protein